MAERRRVALTAAWSRWLPAGLESASVGAFLVPGLALWLPSGYSWGATWLLLCALIGARHWWGRPLDASTRLLAGLILALGVLWSLDTGPRPGIASTELLAKYLAALACLGFLMSTPPRPSALWAGLAVGGLGSGVVALVQTVGLGLERAHGFTNAIQYGNLSLLIGIMALAALLVLWPHLTAIQRVWLACGGALGLVGSLLSETRGGWLALLPMAAVLMLVLARRGLGARVWRAALALGVASALAWPFVHGELQARLDLASSEVQAYVQRHEAATSIGQRLEHWRLAARMGSERPLFGWGGAYDAEKRRQVEAGLADPFVLGFGHAHNEILDTFARRGLIGVALLLLYLLLPLWLFWPRAARIGAGDGDLVAATRLALGLVGILLPLGYLGFGLTQVFFSHNSGHMFYLFMLILVQAALAGLDPLRTR